MNSLRSLPQRLFLLLMMVVLVILPSWIGAAEHSLRITSHLLGGIPQEKHWQNYRLELQSDTGDWTARFFSESGSRLCLIQRNGEYLHIDKGALGTKEIEAPIFITSGYPVPLDVLPRSFTPGSGKYHFSSVAGGRTFVHSYTVTVTPVEKTTAQEQGWLRTRQSQNVAALYLIQAYDSSDKMVCQQLWSPEFSWWFYESTPFRESWCID